MAKISFFELEPFEKKFFQTALKGHTLRFDAKPLTSRNAAKHADADAIIVFVMSSVDKKTLDKLPKLKFITTMSTGYNHIDIDETKKRGIRVSTVPKYGSNTVAEFAFALLLCLQRQLVSAIDRTRRGEFEFKGLLGNDLAGKTIGILGTGKIGIHMVQYALAFGMKVLAYDKFQNKQAAKKLGFTYTTVASICKRADIISLHLPLLPETEHILGPAEFKVMKKGMKIINTGRGPLIDTVALNKAVDKKIVASAALDVLEGEADFKKEARLCYTNCTPLSNAQLKMIIQDHKLVNRPEVLVTPHLAFYTEEAVQRILDTTLVNIKGHLNKRYKNTVK